MDRRQWDAAQRNAWGKRIRMARRAADLTQVQLCERIQAMSGAAITPAAVSSWEKGETAPSDWMRIVVARALGGHEAEFFGYTISVPLKQVA